MGEFLIRLICHSIYLLLVFIDKKFQKSSSLNNLNIIAAEISYSVNKIKTCPATFLSISITTSTSVNFEDHFDYN